MSRRTMLIVVGLVGLYVFMHVVGSPSKHTAAVKSDPPMAPKPLPVAPPTVTPQSRPRSSPSASAKRPKKSAKPAKNDYELSTLRSTQRLQLTQVVKIFASWPGKPKKQLVLKLRKLRPFVTNEAISQIASAWGKDSQTFRRTV
jgi:hypothetical protein